jgi:hypothetical protein
VRLIFIDDSRQNSPSRPGMGPLVATGGLIVPAENVKNLEASLNGVCQRFQFPAGEEFKWSPTPGSWMHQHLHGSSRESFFLEVISHLGRAESVVVVVIEDRSRKPANAGLSSEQDTVVLFLERAANRLRAMGDIGLVIADRPGGGLAQEEAFLSDCLEMLETGTAYVRPDEICLNVVSTSSKLVRLLQAADVITSSVTAYVAGESQYSPPIFAAIRPLFPAEYSRSGGVGLKIHPDFRYANLYHWILGDTHFMRYQTGSPMPLLSYPYASGPLNP